MQSSFDPMHIHLAPISLKSTMDPDSVAPDSSSATAPPTTETIATSARPLYVPDTLEQTPLEPYTARSARAERVAVALEKLAGNLRASGPQGDDVERYLGEPITETTEDSCDRGLGSGVLQYHLDREDPAVLVASATVPLTEDIVPLVIESMVQHRADPRVADRALTTLRRLTARDAARENIGNCGGIEVIVDVMRVHSLRVRIQTQACLVLANVTYRNPSNKQRVLRARGFQAVVASMSLHRTVEHIQAWGSLALRNFSNSNFSTIEDANLVAGAVDILVSALEVCPMSQVVQNQAPVALANIATSSAEGMARIRTTGGIQTILCSCRRNIASPSLVDATMSCIRALISEDVNQRIFVHHNGIELITDCMNQHRGHPGIAQKGCASFRYLSFQRENRERIGACGGINAIVATIADANVANEDVAEHILKALSNCIYDSIENKTLAGQVGGVFATLSLMSTSPFKESARVSEDGCRALRNLADGVVANHTLILKHRGLAVVLDIVRAHGPVSEGVAEHGIALFVNLATNAAIASQLRHGSGDLTSTALRMRLAHPSSSRVERQVSNLLQLLDNSHSRSARESVERSGHMRRSHGGMWRDISPAISPHLAHGERAGGSKVLEPNEAPRSFGSASMSSSRRISRALFQPHLSV
jgi:hypothetical protein